MSYLSLEFWESDVNVAGNHSTLHVNVTAHLDPGHNAWSNYATTVSFNCAGQNGAITVPSYNIPSGGSAYLGSAAFVIGHNNDGSYSGACSVSWNTGTIGALSGSGNYALTTIPRATQPTVSFSDGNHRMGTSMTINLPAASSAFTHTVSYGCVKAGGTIATGAKGSVNWVIPKDLAYQIPAVIGGKAQVQVAVDTYSGGTHIGTKSCWFDVMISDDMRPTLGSLTIARVDNGLPSTFGVYVQGISKATLTANNGQGSYGSQVVSCAISGAGFSSGGSPATFGPFTTAGALTFTATVTDSRGRTVSKTVSIVVYEYKPPTLMFTAQRCTSSGLVNETGAYILVKPVYSCASVNGKNSIASKSFSVNGSSNTTVASGSNCIIGAGSVAINKQWDVTGSVTDLVGNKAQISVKIGTSKVPFNIRADANGAAFGKYSEIEGRLESVWPINAPGITANSGMQTANGSMYANGSIELYYVTPFLDFHSDSSTADYTARLLNVGSQISLYGDLWTTASLTVSGAKNRAVATNDYGTVALNAVESGSAVFQDYGGGVFDEQGVCIIYHDPVFLATTNSKIKYNVQLTKCYKGGDIWYNERSSTPEYMVIEGEPGKNFKWVVTMKQRGYEDKHFDTIYELDTRPVTEFTGAEDLAKKEYELMQKEDDLSLSELFDYVESIAGKELYE